MIKTPEIDQINNHITNAVPDLPDCRDWYYRPALINLASRIDPPRNLHILDQKNEPACTGFALAAVINYLNLQRGDEEKKVSMRMLYEMARRNDEWQGEDYSGSSCRGAIKGWYNMGVAEEALWSYQANKPGKFSVAAAKNARANTVGAYYRLNHRVSDFHAALNEAGVVYCSARVHQGWQKKNVLNGKIPFSEKYAGSHAFAIVGYDDKGFLIQNSWGKKWGKDGLAIWSYEDWQKNIQDAWVLRLALGTPQIWHLDANNQASYAAKIMASKKTNRAEIAGHFVHIDDGEFKDSDKYWSNLEDVKITTDLLADSKDYDHILLYAHGGLNSPDASAKRIESMKSVFKENRIYPYHFMYDTGLKEELKDLIFRKKEPVEDRAGGVTDATDWLLEKLTRIPGRAFWREMKSGARLPFNKPGAGTQVLQLFLQALQKNNQSRIPNKQIKLHIIGHSTGAILLGWLLNRISQLPTAKRHRIASAALLAPAASVDFYKDHYHPALKSKAKTHGIDELHIYNLSQQLELDDSVGPYRKSLLYLVSRAFEEKRKTPILGMQKHAKLVPDHPKLKRIISTGINGKVKQSWSETHGGFDNDVRTMNSLLKNMLKKNPKRLFTAQDLDY
ncbi:C1 family peptidase [Marinicella litoralis]|uniref:Papain like protease n=1 Tax=Marinicella litoralis TaxID=644220 RepID=A0A4R6Y0H3_9GAMM|nr:C1 family peptidase [Marinicella litoralis]TDR22408.1 papain like protease [Marinicella litoralis]